MRSVVKQLWKLSGLTLLAVLIATLLGWSMTNPPAVVQIFLSLAFVVFAATSLIRVWRVWARSSTGAGR